MRIAYDVATQAITVDDAGARPWGADVQAALNRHGQRIEFRQLRFGLRVTVNGTVTVDREWPPAGTVFARTDQDILLTERVRWSPDDAVELLAWFENDGERLEVTHSLAAPRPPQPYPSWTWDGTRWAAPEPYPDDGGEYVWGEAEQTWSPLP